jgi:hypothetical protein
MGHLWTHIPLCALLWAGCGGRSTGARQPSCASLSACGGNLIGSWSGPTQTCPLNCSGASLLTTSLPSFTITFGADGNAMLVEGGTSTSTLTAPLSCLGVAQCGDLDRPGVTCTGTDPCTCHTNKSFDAMASIPYAVTGSTLTWDPGAAGKPVSYCVQNDYLWLGGLGGTGELGSAIYVRQ